jgi:hypothetical protein
MLLNACAINNSMPQNPWASCEPVICHYDTCCQRTSDYTSVCAVGESPNRTYIVYWDVAKK